MPSGHFIRTAVAWMLVIPHSAACLADDRDDLKVALEHLDRGDFISAVSPLQRLIQSQEPSDQEPVNSEQLRIREYYQVASLRAAQQLIDDDKLKKATGILHELAVWQIRQYGADHWRIAETELLLDDIDRLDSLGPEDRKKIRDTNRKIATAAELREQGNLRASAGQLNEAVGTQIEILERPPLPGVEEMHRLADACRAADERPTAIAIRQSLTPMLKAMFRENHPRVAENWEQLGALFLEQGDLTRADTMFVNALPIRRKCFGVNSRAEASIKFVLGNINRQAGDYIRAEANLTDAINISRIVANDSLFLARVLAAQGSLAAFRRDLPRAQPLCEEALGIMQKRNGDPQDMASVLLTLGIIAVEQREFGRADTVYQQAAELLSDTVGEDDPQYLILLTNRGAMHLAQQDYAQAITYLTQALKLCSESEDAEGQATILNNLAIAHRKLKAWSKAADYHARAFELSCDQLQQKSLFLTESAQLVAAREIEHRLYNYLELSALDEEETKRQYEAVLRWKGNIFAGQLVRRIALEGDPMLSGLLQKVNADLARVSLQTIENDQEDQRVDEEINGLMAMKRQIDLVLARKVKGGELSTSYGDLVGALPNQSALVDFIEYRAKSNDNPSGIRKVTVFIIRKDASIKRIDLPPLEEIEQAILSWRDNILSQAGVGRGKVRPKRSHSRGQNHALDGPRHRLHELVWKPIEAILGDAQQVFLSPDGILSQCPFAALPGQATQYLIEEKNLISVPVPKLFPGATPIADKPQSQPLNLAPVQRLILVGDVAFRSEPSELPTSDNGLTKQAARAAPAHFSPLPGTKQEIAKIETLFKNVHPGTEVEILRQDAASELAFKLKAPQGRYLHIATHGFFANDVIASKMRDSDSLSSILFANELLEYHPGLLSGLAFAGASRDSLAGQDSRQRGDDGLLTAMEVANLNLNAELVVLSACETQLGRVARGEGVLGLQRSFQIAGAKSVVASLWNIDDRGTELLMVEFYKNLWERWLSKSESIRQAQLAMLNGSLYQPDEEAVEGDAQPTRLPPYYWAPFVISGDWK